MIDSQKKSLILGSLAAAGCEILFGLSYVFTKQVASESGVFALLGWRFFVAIAVMSLFMSSRSRWHQRVVCLLFLVGDSLSR